MDQEQDKVNQFREKLDSHYAWPALYTFKFIVPGKNISKLVQLFPNHEHAEKPSRNGTYTAVTYNMMMPSGDAVIEIYKKAAKVEGLIAL